MIRSLILVAALLCWSNVAFAQSSPQSAQQSSESICASACRSEGLCYYDGSECVGPGQYDSGRQSPAMFVTGIVSIGLGGANVLAGVALYGLAALYHDTMGEPNSGPAPVPVGSAVLWGVGGSLIVVGAVLTGVGNQDKQGDHVPSVAIGPGSGSLSWQF